MSYNRVYGSLAAVFIGLLTQVSIFAGELLPPKVSSLVVTNKQKRIHFTPYPAVQEFRIFKSDRLDMAFVEDLSGTLSGYDWTAPLAESDPIGFYRLQVTPISADALLVSTVLNRLAYGPTPDELERVTTIGPQAYIDEQLAPELIQETLPIDAVSTGSATGWQFFKATGNGSGSSTGTNLYVYLNVPGEGYIDDIKMVAGSVAESGPNLIRNGDFELPMTTNEWFISANHAGSAITAQQKHSGNGALHLVASSAGTTFESSIWQSLKTPIATTQTYTLSYWYLSVTNKPSSPTVRLAGSGIVSSPYSLSLMTKLAYDAAQIADLQAWYAMHAVQSKRQFLEVMTQFVDNHFTTLYTKSRDFMDGKLSNDDADDLIATSFKFRELTKWRDVLTNPNGTFYDLLRISAESPAMIIYLDTVTSSKGAANENYSREIMELFTMGVDNGYEQKDIEEMSRAWTGWRVDKLATGQENNPFAAAVKYTDDVPGYWNVRFTANSHDATTKTIFAGKTLPSRFGPTQAGKSYQLTLPARTGTDGMKDGYDIITHLANLPFTQEYIIVKLCRLLVHERFVHGLYDYTDPNLSAEAKLVRDSMVAWETPASDGRKGNLRNVLKVILNSSLFRHDTASRQKVKTPFEFTVSTVRSIRAARSGGGFTADSNGTDISNASQTLGMRLFYREEPDGWPEEGQDWINTSALVDRMRYAQTFLRSANKNFSDPVALLKMKLPSTQWRDAGKVVDYFLTILFPGEGKANLDLDRTAAIAYLNSTDAGTASSLFSSLDPNSLTTYDPRVRSMVAMLMGLPRFQEQ